MSSLHNPRAVWFLGAPVSKAIAISTVAMFVLAEVWDLHDALIFDTTKMFDNAEVYRILVYNLTFASIGELVFGLAALCPLMRRFEREMGSHKFGTFLFCTTVLSTFFELVFFQIFFDTERYSGPYPQLGALLFLYHKYTPRMHPKFFGVLGYDFSEKALTYGLCAQAILSGGLSTAVPAFLGAVSAHLWLHCGDIGLPGFMYAAAESLGFLFMDESPAIMMSRSIQRGTAGGGRENRPARQAAGGGPELDGGAAPVVQAPQAPPPPSEEAITQLTSMGFDRVAVVRALGQTDNNVEAAANRLLTS